jgi:hypothetical protein
MAVDKQYLHLGPMNITFNGNDLGGTKGGITVSVKENTTALIADQTGSTALDHVVSGHEFSVKVALAELKSRDILAAAFPRAEVVGSTDKKYNFKSAVGKFLSDSAAALVLHPTAISGTNKSNDIKFPLAAVKSTVELKYGPEEQTVLEVEFAVYPDTNGIFMIYGDPTLT